MKKAALHLGVDDTDSDRGGCTTHLGHILVGKALSLGAEFNDYPNLVRLNPDIPWKTRGNGAVCLRIGLDVSEVDGFWEEAVATAEDYIGFTGERDLGMVLYIGEDPPEEAKELSRVALRSAVSLSGVRQTIESLGVRWHAVGSRRGLVGALSAVGNVLLGVDHTFELLAYRTRENWGAKRMVVEASVLQLQEDPLTFANIDPETGRVLVTPRGLDPVLLGIRGDTAESVHAAFERVDIGEELRGWTIFVTNQGTGSHLEIERRIEDLEPYEQVRVVGTLARTPKILVGGHVRLSLRDDGGELLDCMAYAPSGQLSTVARRLVKGDLVRVSGGVLLKPQGLTLNLERIEVVELVAETRRVPPVCPRCRRSMSSLGMGQGYECRGCSYHISEVSPGIVHRGRDLSPRILLPPYRSGRHLTKPLKRYGRPNIRDAPGIGFKPWTSFLLG